MYMMWFDDGKKPTSEKLADAVAAYVRHFRTKPNIVLVNQADQDATVSGVTVRAANHVRQHNFWVGWEESTLQG